MAPGPGRRPNRRWHRMKVRSLSAMSHQCHPAGRAGLRRGVEPRRHAQVAAVPVGLVGEHLGEAAPRGVGDPAGQMLVADQVRHRQVLEAQRVVGLDERTREAVAKVATLVGHLGVDQLESYTGFSPVLRTKLAARKHPGSPTQRSERALQGLRGAHLGHLFAIRSGRDDVGTQPPVDTDEALGATPWSVAPLGVKVRGFDADGDDEAPPVLCDGGVADPGPGRPGRVGAQQTPQRPGVLAQRHDADEGQGERARSGLAEADAGSARARELVAQAEAVPGALRPFFLARGTPTRARLRSPFLEAEKAARARPRSTAASSKTWAQTSPRQERPTSTSSAHPCESTASLPSRRLGLLPGVWAS